MENFLINFIQCPHPCLECTYKRDCIQKCRGDRILAENCSCPFGKFDDFHVDPCLGEHFINKYFE